jgi:serine/threonine protein kinase
MAQSEPMTKRKSDTCIDGRDAKSAKSCAPRFVLGKLIGHGSYGVVFDLHEEPESAPCGGKQPLPSSDGASSAETKRKAMALKLFDPPSVELLTEGLQVTLRPLEGAHIACIPQLLVAAREHALHDVCTVYLGDTPCTLGYMMPKHTPLTPEHYATLHLHERYTLVSALAQELRLLHAKGLVHGDVKCANVLLQANGKPVWCDFSLLHAAPYWPSCAYESFLYAESHRPPEIGRLVSPPADMYALGIMMAALELQLNDDEALLLNKTLQSLPERCAHRQNKDYDTQDLAPHALHQAAVFGKSRKRSIVCSSGGVVTYTHVLHVLRSFVRPKVSVDADMLRSISLLLHPYPERRMFSESTAGLDLQAEREREAAQEEPPAYMSPLQVTHIERYVQEHVARKARKAFADAGGDVDALLHTSILSDSVHVLPRQWELDNLQSAVLCVFMRYARKACPASRAEILHALCACMCLASACCTLDGRMVFTETDFVDSVDGSLTANELKSALARVFNALGGGGLIAPTITAYP